MNDAPGTSMAPPPPPPPPPVEPAPMPVAAAPRRRRTGLVLGVVAGGIVLLAGGGAAGAVFVGGLGTSSSAPGYDPANGLAQAPAAASAAASSAPTTSSGRAATPATSPSASAGVTSPSPSPTTLTQQQATAQLDALAAAGDASTTFDGRWVAQVASKSAGISDPLETTASGSHVFQPTDILAEIAGLRQRVADPSRLVTVLSTEFSANWRTSGGTPYWVTVYDGGFGSKAEAASWCSSTFADLSAAQRADACLPKTLTSG